MRYERILELALLVGILFSIGMMRVDIAKWGEEITLTKVTTVEHHYHWDVQSYGTIRLNSDDLQGLELRR